MSALSTYADARFTLDGLLRDLEKKMRTRLDAAEDEMAASLEGIERDLASQGGVRALAAEMRSTLEAGALSAIHGAHALAVADLIRAVLPHRARRKAKTGVVSTRSPVTPSGRRKPFPSDSPKWRGENFAPGGHRRYVRRFPAVKLPKKWGEPEKRKVGRPRVPAAVQLMQRKVASRKRLASRRAETTARREALGWKPYPWPRKRPGAGWSVVQDSPDRVTRQEAAREKKRRRDAARAFIRRVAEGVRDKWIEAHLP